MGESDKDDLIRILEEDEEVMNIPPVLPLLPVRDVVIFTDMLLPLFIGREKSVHALEKAVEKDKLIFLATQIDPTVEEPKNEDLYRVGTIGKVLRMLKLPDGRVKTLVQGVAKAGIVAFIKRRSGVFVKIELMSEQPVKQVGIETEALMRNVREQCERILSYRGEMTPDISSILESIDDPGKLADLVASNLKLKIEDAQKLLEQTDSEARLRTVNEFLSKEVELSAVQAKIQSDVREVISRSQRDFFLREQVRVIHRELGESDERSMEAEEYLKRIKKARMSRDADDEARKQLKRLGQMHPDASEAAIIRAYLDWLADMPWGRFSKDVYDIRKAKEVLDKDHYGLDKVKDRILEHLSVRKLNPAMKGPILCFVGPPGVGKTSLGQAIARAMKRKFVRISLGGIRDEAEIRGHRRTYIGAMPGRIIQGVKQSGTRNPVFMMDEIDKIGADFRGDPSSALLEALDPEQNSAFSDHYLNLSYDLSHVMFVLTANITDTIPYALLDRMEIIMIAGYTEDEKQIIADRHLIPRQIKENGLKPRNLSLGDKALRQIISEYTSESGLRNLEREIASICRKTARKLAEGEKGPFTITRSNLHRFLGPAKFIPEMDQENSQVGLSTGLAWTQVGGEVLYVEASLTPGKGELIITGQLGEIMQESARAALTYTRAGLVKLGVEETFFEQLDVHIHVPAGAIPKDGPSAGIAMAAALMSAVSRRPVDKYVAMTGEITLRGRVLPIGGLKEKALGALRGGIRTILYPGKNKKDLVEIPGSLKRRIKFVPVNHMDEVLEIALLAPEAPLPVPGKKKAASGQKKRRRTTSGRRENR